jgi:hypothetical protein
MLSLLVLVSGWSGGRTAILGITMFAVPLIVLNVNLPDFQPQWINHWLIPWMGGSPAHGHLCNGLAKTD